MNQLWDIFYDQYKKTFKTYDENEEQRLAFTRNSVAHLLKYLSSLIKYLMIGLKKKSL